MKTIDLNSDVGEGFGMYSSFESEALYNLITSANIACGFHAGDPLTMQQTLKRAIANGVAVGAHPGFPDLVGFGRRKMEVSGAEASADLLYQTGALMGLALPIQATLQHIKPHGALYNQAMSDPVLGEALIVAMKQAQPNLIWLALANSPFIDLCKKHEVPYAQEVFADRAYDDQGRLVDRKLPGAVLTDHKEAVAHVKRMVLYGEVKTLSGKVIPLEADSICIHGDNAEALHFAEQLRTALENEGVRFEAFGRRVSHVKSL